MVSLSLTQASPEVLPIHRRQREEEATKPGRYPGCGYTDSSAYHPSSTSKALVDDSQIIDRMSGFGRNGWHLLGEPLIRSIFLAFRCLHKFVQRSATVHSAGIDTAQIAGATRETT